MTTPEFTTQAFLDWLRQQPPEREFPYFSDFLCPVACFCREVLDLCGVSVNSVQVKHDTADGVNKGLINIPKDLAYTITKLGAGSNKFTAAQLLEKFKS